MVLRHRALQLKMQGLALREIGSQLEREYALVRTPPIGTVYDWIQGALRDGVRTNGEDAAQYIRIFLERSEAVIRELMPFISGAFAIERRAVVNGKSVRLIDGDVFDAVLKASSEVRKQGESVLRAQGTNRK